MMVKTVNSPHHEEDITITKIVGFCKAKQVYVTAKQMKQHHCLRVKTDKPCKSFERIEGLFWEKRRQQKQRAKEKRKELRR